MRPQDERDLRTVLHEEAQRHHPDRQAMLDRIGHARTAPAPGALTRLLRSKVVALLPRPVAAAAAVASVLVIAVAGVQVANRSTTPPNPAAATAAPSRSPSRAATTPPARTGAPASPTGRPGAGHTTTSLGSAATVTSPATSAVRDGYLGATAVLDPHSTQAWTQSNLALTSTATITALTVVVRIDRTSGVTDAGHWSSVPAELMTSTVDVQNTVIVYRFTLNTGATLAPGSYVFAAQFNHAGSTRAPTGDTFAATSYAARGSSSDSPTGSARKAEVTGTYTG